MRHRSAPAPETGRRANLTEPQGGNMFQQLLTPVADSLALSFLRRDPADRGRAGAARGCSAARRGRRRSRAWSWPHHRGRGVAAAGRPASDRVATASSALWPVMWIVVNALLLYNIAVALGPVRCVPRLGDRPPAERPARRAGRDRLLLRRAAGGHRRLRHAGRHHQLAADPGRLSAARGAGVRADLQHRAGGLRRARRAR